MPCPKKRDYKRRWMVKDTMWRVRYKNRIRVDGRECDGVCDTELKEIWLANNIKNTILLQTFIHEALHAMEVAWGIKIGERMIKRLEKPLAHFVLHNLLEKEE